MPNKPAPKSRSSKKAARPVDPRTTKTLIKHGQARDSEHEGTRGSIQRSRSRG